MSNVESLSRVRAPLTVILPAAVNVAVDVGSNVRLVYVRARTLVSSLVYFTVPPTVDDGNVEDE